MRPLGAFGLPHCLRISTGTDEENHRFAGALRIAAVMQYHIGMHAGAAVAPGTTPVT